MKTGEEKKKERIQKEGNEKSKKEKGKWEKEKRESRYNYEKGMIGLKRYRKERTL